MKIPFIQKLREHYKLEKALAKFEADMFYMFTFWSLIVLASGIASLGIIRGNLPVVIGAMLITPLVNPFVGVGLAIVTKRPRLFNKSLFRSMTGSLIFWSVAFLLGRNFGEFIDQNSLLSVVKVDIPEVLIAIIAGTVAALALASQKIQSTISGAAIALSIAPPLAVSAIGFSLGNIAIFRQAFYLFGINVLGLIVMAFIIFSLFGFHQIKTEKTLQ